jgi:hypothetical protein
VRQDRELLRRVKRHEIAGTRAAREKVAPPGGGEDALDEIFADPGIAEPSFLLDRQQGKTLGQRARIGAGAVGVGHPLAVVHPNAEETARGRAALEDVAVKVQRFELRHTRAGVAAHLCRQVLATFLDEEPRPISTSGHTGTHSTKWPSVSVRKGSRLWPPS